MKIMNCSGEPLAEHQLLASLELEGIVFLSEADCAEVAGAFRDTLRIYRHPDSGGTPWTVIHPVQGHRYSPGSGGFTSAALCPHTDRSNLDVPPSILCFLMLTDAATGGDSVLVDTRPLLSRYERAALTSLENELWLHSSLQGWRQKVLTVSGSGSVIIRYRDDEVARPRADSRLSGALLRELRSPRDGVFSFHLGPGEGYVIHNHRVLHGRTSFTGPRSGARMLFYVAEASPYAHLNEGFLTNRPRGESEYIG